MKLKAMVDKLNDLQHLLRRETDPLERMKLKMSIDALEKETKKAVREHNKGGDRDGRTR